MTTEQRFWSKINIQEEELCWLWTISAGHNGYGRFQVAGKIKRAHRLAWEFSYGPIPQRINVLHSCDTPLCCNPEHLFLGTHQDNVNDCFRKNRQAKGSTQHLSKLTAPDVVQIRQLYLQNLPITRIAAQFSVSPSCIYDIVLGRTWHWLV